MALNVEELKAKVLDLAIKGKLVDSSKFTGETGVELVERIKAERDKLIQDKIIKKKKLDSISDNDIPFDIHENWVWSQFGLIADFKKGPFGSSITKSMFVPKGSNTVKVYEQKNAIQKRHDIGDYYITEDKFQQLKGFEVNPNDIIISCAGTIGEAYQLPEGIDKGIINQALMRTRLSQYIVPEFFLYYLDVILSSHVTSKSKGSAIKNIPPLKILNAIPFPVISMSEQNAIVDKVKELFEIIDNLSVEAKSQLETLNNLRQKTLDLAIRGKLVSQNEHDEPASELLKRIEDERDKLVKEKKIKKSKKLDTISEAEIPFEIPESWEWVRLNDISEYIQRGKSPKYSDVTKIPVIAQKCVQWSGVSLDLAKFIVPETLDKYAEERYLVHGDLLWNSTGRGSCGRIGVFEDEIRNGYDVVVADSHVTVIRSFKKFVDYEFVFLWLKSPEVQSVIESKATGTTNQIELSTSTIKEQIISLPPISEQQRIVKKVKSIMKIIDNFEDELLRKISAVEKLH